MIKAKLVVVGGDAKAAEIFLSLPTVIGRGREATLTLPHPLVSRQHCELFEREGVLHVRDMKSLNGTYVDSQKIESTATLLPDQLLTIGNVTFRAVYSKGESATDEPMAEASCFIELDQVQASADSDSKIGTEQSNYSGSDPDRGRVVSQSNRQNGIGEEMVPANREQTKKTSASGQSSPKVSDDHPSIVPRPQHSVIAALNGAGIDEATPQHVSIGDLAEQLPRATAPQASNIDGLVVEDAQIGRNHGDLSSIDIDAVTNEKVESDESALGSFIRKLPR